MQGFPQGHQYCGMVPPIGRDPMWWWWVFRGLQNFNVCVKVVLLKSAGVDEASLP